MEIVDLILYVISTMNVYHLNIIFNILNVFYKINNI